MDTPIDSTMMYSRNILDELKREADRAEVSVGLVLKQAEELAPTCLIPTTC